MPAGEDSGKENQELPSRPPMREMLRRLKLKGEDRAGDRNSKDTDS